MTPTVLETTLGVSIFVIALAAMVLARLSLAPTA